MRETRSDTLILIHAVWATKHREPLLPANTDEALRGLIVTALLPVESDLRAFGAFNDHVHVLVRLSAKFSVSEALKAMKGASAHAWNQSPPGDVPRLYWQDGYWARSVTPDAVGAVIRYILQQRIHHAGPHAPETWERALPLS